MKEIKIKADIIVKLPTHCTEKEIKEEILKLEVALNDNYRLAIVNSCYPLNYYCGVRFHFNDLK